MTLRVLVIGGGMYVTGKGCFGYRGTIGPALLEAVRMDLISEIFIYASSELSTLESARLLSDTAEFMGVSASIRCVGSLEILLSSSQKPHCAIISVPDHLHEKYVTLTLADMIPTLVVKPLATSYDSAERLSSLSLNKNTYAIIEYHKRFDKANRFLRQEYLRGNLGSLLYIFVQYSQRKSIPQSAFAKWAGQTNIMSYLGVHYLDLISWITGAIPVAVTAWGQYGFLRSQNIDTFDSIQAVVEWETSKGSAFTSSVLTNWIDPNLSSAVSDQSITLVGTQGRLDSDQKNRGIEYVTDTNALQSINPYFSSIMYDDIVKANVATGYGIESVVSFIQDIHQILANKETLDSLSSQGRPTFSNCLSTYKILSACTASISLGKRIEISAFRVDGY